MTIPRTNSKTTTDNRMTHENYRSKPDTACICRIRLVILQNDLFSKMPNGIFILQFHRREIIPCLKLFPFLNPTQILWYWIIIIISSGHKGEIRVEKSAQKKKYGAEEKKKYV